MILFSTLLTSLIIGGTVSEAAYNNGGWVYRISRKLESDIRLDVTNFVPEVKLDIVHLEDSAKVDIQKMLDDANTDIENVQNEA